MFYKNNNVSRVGNEIGFLLLLVLILPLFPSEARASSYNVNFAILILLLPFSAGLLKLGFIKLANIYLFFLPMQIALILTAFFTIEQVDVTMSYIISMLRPTYLFLVFSIFLGCMLPIKSIDDFDIIFKKLNSFLTVIIVSGLCLALLEVFWGITAFQALLYKRTTIASLDDYITTFFSTSYHSGFFFFSLLVLTIPAFHYKSNVIKFFIWAGVVIVAVLSQSKPIILSVLILVTYFCFFKKAKLKFVIFFSVVLLTLGYSLIKQLALVISNFFYNDSIAARGIIRLLDESEESGSLSVRVDQIIESISAVSHNYYLFGAGAGRDLYLESWPAEVIYRYGFIIFPFIFFLYIYTLYKLGEVSVTFEKQSHYRLSSLAKTLFFWILLLPLTQFSGLMIEEGKLTVISMFLIAMIVKLLQVSKSFR
ncbi:hypothetical protein NDQ71_09975 [Pseudoalteromonas sp. KG3]|uniref:hypothetical protein n=1 Tax=Pseudoalteromonas sp. KG3 TaxID=2951137 RepID=UPI0026581DBF|nr:hypothetical protein [Pseudoalteromonas sp. KG3]WKD22017.1 hypothetical protein NDQ71_09975 [Pseudoalteromonas sp. KG3]